MDDFEARLPTSLWLDAHLHTLTERAVSYYILNSGEKSSGLVAIKLNGLKGQVKLLIQQRDFMSGALEWAPALSQEMVEELEADAYIQRSISRDPDLWVIEIEDTEMQNPFID